MPDTFIWIFFIIVVLIVGFVIDRLAKNKTERKTKHSVGVEIILWLFFIISGVFSRLWHSFSQNKKRN
jgi:heme/copper-type cytochrome/quinol oxidase subunit 2